MKALKKLNDISESSKKNYLFYLQKINGGMLPTSADFYFNISDIKEKIKDYSPATKLLIVNAIMTILSKYKSIKYLRAHNVYKIYRDNVLIKEHNNYKERKKNPDDIQQTNDGSGETNQTTDKVELQDKINLIERINNPLRRFIYALYSLQTPRRAMDYYSMAIVKNKDQIPEMPVLNYLCEEDKKFYFAKYKTSAIYKIQEIPINDQLWNEYLKYSSTRSEKNNCLLQKENGDPVDNNQFISYHLNRVLGKGKSVNYLRHQYVKENLKNEHKKIEEAAKEMGHSFTTNNYYLHN
jgi:hypothetical protein